MTPEPLNTEFDFEYIKVIDENEIKVSDLPIEITTQLAELKKKHNLLKPIASRYKNNPTEGLKRSFDKNYSEIEKLDLELAQEILNWLEKDLPSEPPAAEPTINEPAEPIKPIEPTPVINTTPGQPPVEPLPPAPSSEPDDDKEIIVRSKIRPDNRITIKELAVILGYKPNGMPISIGKLTLRAVPFNSSEYRIV